MPWPLEKYISPSVNKPPGISLAFLSGFVSLVFQILIFRELAVVFNGHELIYAIGFAAWLFWTGCGAFSAGLAGSFTEGNRRGLMILQSMLIILLPLTVAGAVGLRHISGSGISAPAGIVLMFFSSFFLLAPVTLILGHLVALVCRVAQEQGRSAKTIVEIYGAQFWGAAVGGLFFSLLPVHWFSSLTLAWGLGLLLIPTVWILWPARKIFQFSAALILSWALLGCCILPRAEIFLKNLPWPAGVAVLEEIDSISGRVVLTKQGNEYHFFENGLLSFSTHDTVTSEENVHYALLAHRDPHRILLIGNGLGGELREILKYPLVDIDYAVADPVITPLARRHFSPGLLLPLDSVLVRVLTDDSRLFVRNIYQRYDVIIVNVAAPRTIFANRFYTEEFFRDAAAALRPNGVLSFRMPPLDIARPENQYLLGALYATLKNIFPRVETVPGEGEIFLAMGSDNVFSFDGHTLGQRLAAWKIKNSFVTPVSLAASLDIKQRRELDDRIQRKGILNADERPINFLLNMGFPAALIALEKYAAWLAVLPVSLALCGYFYSVRRKGAPVFLLSMGANGFVQAILLLLTIYLLQGLYGYAYVGWVFVVTAFVAGTALGSSWAKFISTHYRAQSLPVFQKAQIAMIILPLSYPLIINISSQLSFPEQWAGPMIGILLLISAALGCVSGLQYALAVPYLTRHRLNRPDAMVRQVSFLYGVNAWAATAGILLGGLFLIPLYGTTTIVFLCVSLNLVMGVLLNIFFRSHS